jgi:hypothetical protein
VKITFAGKVSAKRVGDVTLAPDLSAEARPPVGPDIGRHAWKVKP